MGTMRVLLVDDEERFVTTTKALLERRGIEAFAAGNGHEAMEALKDRPIDVVVLDVKMPGLDGVEVLRLIKQQHALVEVIMLTGHATVESAVDGLKLGAFDYVMKPCDIAILIDKITEAHARKAVAEEKIRQAKIDNIISDPWSVFDKE